MFVLKQNDTVALIAPAGFILNNLPIILAKEWLEALGFNVWVGKNVLNKFGVFAGTDDERIEDFQTAINDQKIKAIWALRGGYGAMRIIEKLDYTPLKKNKKLLIGFSDITVFHNQWQILGLPCIHGIMPIQIIKNSLQTKLGLDSLRKAMMGEKLTHLITSSPFNRVGCNSGILTGGNLTLLQNLIGTPYQVATKGKILFIEDVGEYKYRIDRLLYSLKLAGVFDELKGLIVGGFNDLKETETPFGKNIEEMILEVTQDTQYPILFGFPAGHFPDNRALILGKKITLNVGNTSSFLLF